jgi:hypothetical protein
MGPIRQLGAKALAVAVNDIPPISYKHFRQVLNPSSLTKRLQLLWLVRVAVARACSLACRQNPMDTQQSTVL